MAYTRRELERELRWLLRDLVGELEKRAKCHRCEGTDVVIADSGRLAHSYVIRISELIADRAGLR